MEIEKLIGRLRTESLYKDKATLEIMDLCMEAAETLERLNNFSESQCAKLLAENAQLREELEREKQYTAYYEHLTDMGLEASKKLLANLEKLKSERDTLRYFFEDVANKPDCNTCANKNCEYRPGLGQTTRFNCPL